MKDLHSHLLYGIDDGSKTLEESIQLLKEMEKEGVDECILTPHYIENSKYDCNNNDKLVIFNELVEEAKKERIKIKLYLGNEVFVTSNFISLLKEDKIKTLNDSRYLLFELPMRQNYHNLSELISELIRNDYVPILAHPERYDRLQKHPDIAGEYLRCGLLLQGNFTTLCGKYGRRAEKTLKYFLKNKWISFLGSDTHHDVDFDMEKIRKKLLKITKDENYVNDLLVNNFDKVINNEEIGLLR